MAAAAAAVDLTKHVAASLFSAAERQGALRANGGLRGHLDFVNTSRPFVACFAPKTGCTLWKALVLYVNGGENFFDTVGHSPGKVHNRAVGAPTVSRIDRFPGAATSERVIIARNPYDRFLSSYQDWLGRDGLRKNGTTNDTITFAEFADRYERRDFRGFRGTLMNHIETVSKFCDHEHVRYVVLRIEEMDLWFDAVLQRYDLGRFVRSLKPGQFYRASVDDTTTVRDRVREALRLQGWTGEAQHTAHARMSTDKRFDYYTPALAAKVCALQARDFTNFGYPCWDGIEDTFRIL